MDPITLGIDLATASARCVAVDGCTGAVLARAHAPLPAPVRSAGGVSRQEADYAAVAFAVIAAVCRELASAAARVGALSVTGTSGTVVGCDPSGRPLADARLYDDRSSSGAVTAVAVRPVPRFTGGNKSPIWFGAFPMGLVLPLSCPSCPLAP